MELDHTVCCIKGCDLPSLALGLCNKHWRRNRAYGSPAATQKHSGMFIGKTPLERFNLQHKKREGGCWEWVSGKDSDGYGLFRGLVGDALYMRAHRWSWAHHNQQPIPSQANVCHSCDNPSCVNPAHLWLGTALENQRDKWAKGRGNIQRGASLPHAKLSEEQVRQILADPRPASRICAEYGISSRTVSDLKTRRSWAHLDVQHIAKAQRVSPRKGVSEKLNEDAVRDIRSSAMTGKELAAKYGVSVQYVCDIRKRRAWKHIT